jgi:hypothetical protein
MRGAAVAFVLSSVPSCAAAVRKGLVADAGQRHAWATTRPTAAVALDAEDYPTWSEAPAEEEAGMRTPAGSVTGRDLGPGDARGDLRYRRRGTLGGATPCP